MKDTVIHLVITEPGFEKTMRAILWSVVLLLFIVSPLWSADQPAAGREKAGPFPAYGKGNVIVRIYTDYFCPPCQAMEPKLEPLLEDLVKRNIIHLTFVDTPLYRYSPLYARYFLYALNHRNDFNHALAVRNMLFDGAVKKVSETEGLEQVFKEKGIPFKSFDVLPVFKQLNEYLKEDRVNATPVCTIIRGGKQEKHSGPNAIINALTVLGKE